MNKLLCAATLLFIALAAFTLVFARDIAGKLRAKETVTHMRRLDSLLQLEKPASVEARYLATLLKKNGMSPSFLLDGWGRPLLVEILTAKDGVRHYRIRSLGRDGRLGNCCKRFVSQAWDEDAVIEDGLWLQCW